MKKLLLALASVLILASLIGCGSNDNANNVDGGESHTISPASDWDTSAAAFEEVMTEHGFEPREPWSHASNFIARSLFQIWPDNDADSADPSVFIQMVSLSKYRTEEDARAAYTEKRDEILDQVQRSTNLPAEELSEDLFEWIQWEHHSGIDVAGIFDRYVFSAQYSTLEFDADAASRSAAWIDGLFNDLGYREPFTEVPTDPIQEFHEVVMNTGVFASDIGSRNQLDFEGNNIFIHISEAFDASDEFDRSEFEDRVSNEESIVEFEIVAERPFLHHWAIHDINGDREYWVFIRNQNIIYSFAAPAKQRAETDAIIAALGF